MLNNLSLDTMEKNMKYILINYYMKVNIKMEKEMEKEKNIVMVLK